MTEGKHGDWRRLCCSCRKPRRSWVSLVFSIAQGVSCALEPRPVAIMSTRESNLTLIKYRSSYWRFHDVLVVPSSSTLSPATSVANVLPLEAHLHENLT